MNILNSKVDRVFLISSPSTIDRLDRIVPILNDENIEFELVIAPNKSGYTDYTGDLKVFSGAKSLLSVNESILLNSRFNRYKSICVFEDDVFFGRHYMSRLTSALDDVLDWDILNLGYHINTSLHEPTPNDTLHRIRPPDQVVGTHCVCYTDSVYDVMLDRLRYNIYPVDWFLAKEIYQRFDSYAAIDPVFYASSYRSYEDDSDASYKLYESAINC
jgi:hypothetical protein